MLVDTQSVGFSIREVEPDSMLFKCASCTMKYELDRVAYQYTPEQLEPNTRCQSCNKVVGPFVTKPLMDENSYKDLADTLLTLHPEDLLNMISRAILDRSDIKIPDDMDSYTLAGHLVYQVQTGEDRTVTQEFTVSVRQHDGLPRQAD